MTAVFHPAILSGKLPAVPSKSDAHRVLFCAALADAPTTLELTAFSQDIEATMCCMTALGARFQREGSSLTVYPIDRLQSRPKPPLLDCGESGSTLRFLLPVAAALSDSVGFTAQEGLAARPIDELCKCMSGHGVSFSASRIPFELCGRLTPGDFLLPGNISSQYISGLLFALPMLGGDSRIILTTPLESAGYVEMTLETLRRFGVTAEKTEDGYCVPGNQRYHSPGRCTIEGDWSNSAFLLAAGALSGPVTVSGLSKNSLQRDCRVTELLEQFGAKVTWQADSVTVSHAELHGITVSVRDIPDLVPALAVVAAVADGKTTFADAGRLRLKESDRLASVSALLVSLGVEAIVQGDSLIVVGNPNPSGGHTESENDHRIAMAAAILASRCRGETTLSDPMAVRKSYPHFYEDYRMLGGAADGL